MISLLIGLTIGAIAMLIFMEVQYAASRSSYEEQIKSLQDEIGSREKTAANSNLTLNNTIIEKDKIIASLTEQNSILSRMIAFTSRLARNSTITPTSPQDIDYFQRNIRYLQSLFNQEQEKLKETSYDSTATYNLTPIPQFLE